MLLPMSDAEAKSYVEGAADHFADELARAGNIAPVEAQEQAHKHLATLLPDGHRTVGHHFAHVVRDDERLGELWYQDQLHEQPARTYIFHVHVRPEARGCGVGSAAIEALEAEARRVGASELMLAVFLHNEGAIRLYERLGFEECERGNGGIRMRKSV